MTSLFARFVLSMTVLALLQFPALCADKVTAFVQAFNGGNLGKNVATLIQLKIWRTLRLPPRVTGEPTASGEVLWSTEPFSDSTYEAAEDYARELGARLVVWGSTVEFGDGVLAQCLLAVLGPLKTSGDEPTTWATSISDEGSTYRLFVTIPNLRYELPPVLLSRTLVESYSIASSLKVYSDQTLTCEISELGNKYTRLRDEGDFSEVITEDGHRGWVYLPNLKGEVQVVNLAGGLIRLFRRDYAGAIALLSKISGPDTRLPLRIDSLLLQAIASAKEGNDPGPLIDSALKLNPYLQATVKFELVDLISKLKDKTAVARKDVTSKLARIISDYSYLFPPEDESLSTARKVLSLFMRE